MMATAWFVRNELHMSAECEDCAYCGNNESVTVWDSGGFKQQVLCDYCGVHGPHAIGPEAVFIAVELWNKMNRNSLRMRKLIMDAASILIQQTARRPCEECPDLESYPEGHCDFLALVRNVVETNR